MPHVADWSKGWFLTGVFLVSATVLMFQLMLSRIFSVTAWYHVSFLVISIAMFGMTAGAVKVYRGDPSTQRRDLAGEVARTSLHFAITMILAMVVSMVAPIIDAQIVHTVVLLPIIASVMAFPFYYAGIVISLCLTRSPLQVSTVYGYDLLGAAAGCLAALFLMEAIDTPSALFVVCAIPILASFCFTRVVAGPSGLSPRFLVAAAAVVVGFGLFNGLQGRPLVYPFFPKGNFTPQSLLDLDRWNSISRITLTREAKDARPFLWGPSTRFPQSDRSTYRLLRIDGLAGTPMTRFDGTNFDALRYLEYDITSLAYRLPDLKSGAIVGLGGGRDVLTARHFGVESVVALDVNAIQVNLLRDDPQYRAYAGFDELEKVDLIHSEARSWFTRSQEFFDVIQMSMIDTWASTGAGAFALSENGLYTIEGWRVFMDHLNKGGALTVSRWLSKSGTAESGRILSLAVATLLERGSPNPAAHIYLAGTTLPDKNLGTLVVGVEPLTAAQLDALDAAVEEMAFKVIVSPRTPAADPTLKAIAEARSNDDLKAATAGSFLKLSPPTDTQPFFFNQAPLDRPLELLSMVRPDSLGFLPGHVRASLNLFFVIAFSAFVVVAVILLPLRRSVESIDGVTFICGTAYFFLIGLGFMFIEISLLQTMGLFLGHPSLSLAIVLFSLILSTGIGSLTSGRVRLVGRGRFAVWAALSGGYFLVLGLIIHEVFLELAVLELFLRSLVCLALTVPGGILLGFGFPTGMSLCERRNARITPWLWGVNGATGVLGSAVAIATNISLGLDKTMILGALCYVLLLPAALLLYMPAPAPGR